MIKPFTHYVWATDEDDALQRLANNTSVGYSSMTSATLHASEYELYGLKLFAVDLEIHYRHVNEVQR